MKPRIDIISGFLGSGKTTLILEMLKSLPEGERIAICENEYGEVGIDGDAFKEQNFEVIEINAGCVCCTLSYNLISGIKILTAQYKPTRIILEPTGLASLSDILKILRSEDMEKVADVGIPAAVIDGGAMVANYERFRIYFEAQITAASVLFINRTSQLSNDERFELASIIEGINPNARIIAEPFDATIIWEALNTPSSPATVTPSLPKSWLKNFKQVSVNTDWSGSRERLEKFMGTHQITGDLIRAKGYVTDSLGARFRVDFSGGEWILQPAREGGQNMLQFIGRNLAVKMIKEFFLFV